MAINNFKKYSWTSFNIALGLVIGIIFVSLFAHQQKINAFLPLMWCVAYFVMGGLIGFIFSVPKIISDNSSVSVSDINDRTSLAKSKVQENTNLTQISDWLTKILIGAGLVQLKEAPGFILKVSKYMAQGMRTHQTKLETIDSLTLMSAAIILFFLTWGFISGYIVMKLVLTEQFADSAD